MVSEISAKRTFVFNVQDPHSTLLSVNMSSVIKLIDLNYLMWVRQVWACLKDMNSNSLLITLIPICYILSLLMVSLLRIRHLLLGSTKIDSSRVPSSVRYHYPFNQSYHISRYQKKSRKSLPKLMAI